jgi:hypothetical protein
MNFIAPRKAALLLAAGIFSAPAAYASSVSYFLDQSNVTGLPDGVNNYLRVTIDDTSVTCNMCIGGDSIITFTVDVLTTSDSSGPLVETTNFGIMAFGFNIADSVNPGAANFLLPSAWGVANDKNGDGFGKFERLVKDGGSNRLDPLVFSIDIAGDTINSYYDLSTGTASEGNTWFAAHVAGINNMTNGSDSAWFGGGTAVPVPAAFWLFGSGLLGMAAVARRKISS